MEDLYYQFYALSLGEKGYWAQAMFCLSECFLVFAIPFTLSCASCFAPGFMSSWCTCSSSSWTSSTPGSLPPRGKSKQLMWSAQTWRQCDAKLTNIRYNVRTAEMWAFASLSKPGGSPSRPLEIFARLPSKGSHRMFLHSGVTRPTPPNK